MSDCILWTGPINNKGYRVDGKFSAHRIAYIRAYGQVPVNKELHHTCGVRHCTNSEHIVALTRAEHSKLHAVEQTHCKNGHEYTPETVYSRPGKTQRDCRICAKERMRTRRKHTT